MAISEPYELDGVTIGGTAVSIVNGNTTPASVTDDGAYQLWIDPGVMAKGDEFEIRILEKVEGTGGAQKTACCVRLLGAQVEVLPFPTLVLINGWDMTIKKLVGTDRAFDASIRKIA